MFRFTIRQLMLATLAVALVFVADRQILWLRARREYAKCVAFANEHLQLTGAGVFIPNPPGAGPHMFPRWQTRAELVQELETITEAARSLEGTVKEWREKRRAWEKAGKPDVWDL